MKVATQFAVEPMRVEQIPAVAAIERQSFSQPWPQSAYRREILENATAHYIVARHLEGHALASSQVVPIEPPARIERDDRLFDRIARFLRSGSIDSHRSVEGDPELSSIVGYAGLWLMVDEGHITTIAVHPGFRGRGLGELLLHGLIDRAMAIGARWLTLEVRVSNHVAQQLYRKYTFKEMGIRRRYYSDNDEDAMVMWTDPLDSPTFQAALERGEQRLAERLGAEIRLGDRWRSLERE